MLRAFGDMRTSLHWFDYVTVINDSLCAPVRGVCRATARHVILDREMDSLQFPNVHRDTIDTIMQLPTCNIVMPSNSGLDESSKEAAMAVRNQLFNHTRFTAWPVTVTVPACVQLLLS